MLGLPGPNQDRVRPGDAQKGLNFTWSLGVRNNDLDLLHGSQTVFASKAVEHRNFQISPSCSEGVQHVLRPLAGAAGSGGRSCLSDPPDPEGDRVAPRTLGQDEVPERILDAPPPSPLPEAPNPDEFCHDHRRPWFRRPAQARASAG